MSYMTDYEKLSHAETEYHALLTGTKARVVVDQNGERVEFSAANRSELKKYIDDLKATLGVRTARRGPLNPFF